MNAHHTRRAGRRTRARLLAVAAGSLALAVGTSVAASADEGGAVISKPYSARANTLPARTAFATQAPTAATQNTWAFGIDGRDSAGTIWDYPPKAAGGFAARVKTGTGMGSATAFFKNNSANTAHVNVYARFGSQLRVFTGSSGSGTVLAGGWGSYNAFVTPGNIGGAAYPDLLARDTSGVLWEYLSNSNGTFGSRVRVGAGWNIYTQIAGRDDLTGDGKADIVARDSSGTLWLYKGTGTYKQPFLPRTKIGAGWNTYNKLIALGDTNGDGHNDLLARDTHGVLWFYAGTGNAAAPYKTRAQIGTNWNSYNYLF
ncbi:FG-GAP repeat domain-containing protein [Actinacidiphila acididurans]|nr:VCBS repeat-containing protein [Actinacidiphila acididurans]